MRTLNTVVALLLTVLLAGLLPAGASADPTTAGLATPQLDFHAPEEMAPLAERLEQGLDRAAVGRAMRLVGVDDAGAPIPVYLAPEGTPLANAPSWVRGYVRGGNVVLLPARVPAYPNRSLEAVLLHEIAHVLIDRAADGRTVPRWFHEGLALYAARGYVLEDRSRVLWSTLRGRRSAVNRLEENFASGPASAARAYAFSGAFVRFLIDRYGNDLPGGALEGVAEGRSFPNAFRRAAGTGLADAERSFYRQVDFWNRWVPFLGSSTTLWILVTLLAVVAIKRRRERDAEIRAQWIEEEEQEFLRRQTTDGWVN